MRSQNSAWQELHALLSHAEDQAFKNQWLNVLSALSQANDVALERFSSVLKGEA
jgi:hypothetical protein